MTEVNEHGLLVENVPGSLDANARRPIKVAGVSGRELMRPTIETTYETVTVGAVKLRRKVVAITKPEPVVKKTPAKVPAQKPARAAKRAAAKPPTRKTSKEPVDELATSEVAPDPRDAQGGDQE